MNLKPSFALKLNPQGFSPTHVAIQQNVKRMVFSFVGMSNNLVRVKGREGWTPLHFASHNEEVDLLAKFLVACPDSIEDVTVRGETALHIALKNNKFKALDLLVCFLKNNMKRGARKLEYNILNRKDEDDNTILHISALWNEPKVTFNSVSCIDIFLLSSQSKKKIYCDCKHQQTPKQLHLSHHSFFFLFFLCLNLKVCTHPHPHRVFTTFSFKYIMFLNGKLLSVAAILFF